jgi:beta-lactamase regulating signal transducer with metallopeptidase domain
MKHRSAAERSCVAHIGLLALIIMAFAPLVLPKWSVEAPALFSPTQAIETRATAPAATPSAALPLTDVNAASALPSKATRPHTSISAAAAASAIYAVPAAILLLITLLALIRLVALQARAEVLVDSHWLTALARAQRQMGFKHGTALLTSNALASPISWGLMRPVILLNSRAVEASDEAEAIIAHELAHVARMDWVKLLLARVATALFWFNPFVWMLAKEAHQLREEAADDAVLGANIPDTDYAQLLVGVARHECPGLLLGAHGVAPSRSSLARRVARVLDGKSVRGPVARSFAIGVFVGAVMVAAPLAALTLTPAGTAKLEKVRSSTVSASEPLSAYYPAARDVPADLPHIIAKGVSTSVASAVAAIGQAPQEDFRTSGSDGSTVTRINGVTVATASSGATVTEGNGAIVSRAPSGATVTVYPTGANGKRKVVAVASNGATAVSYVAANAMPGMEATGQPDAHSRERTAIDMAVAMKAVGVTAEYVASIKSVLPQLRLTSEDLVQLKAVGVTPDFIQELARDGYRNVDVEDIVGAFAGGVRSDYIRGMAAVGYPQIPLEQLTELKAVGVLPSDVERFRRAGFTHLDVDELVQAKSMGLTPEEIKASRDGP